MKREEWIKKAIAEADSAKPVKFDYVVYDCEHMGDMRRAEFECEKICRKYGGKIVDSYWDGRDCGEAYITCEFPFSKVEEILQDRVFRYDFYQY